MQKITEGKLFEITWVMERLDGCSCSLAASAFLDLPILLAVLPSKKKDIRAI